MSGLDHATNHNPKEGKAMIMRHHHKSDDCNPSTNNPWLAYSQSAIAHQWRREFNRLRRAAKPPRPRYPPPPPLLRLLRLAPHRRAVSASSNDEVVPC